MTIDNAEDEALALDLFHQLTTARDGIPGWMAEESGLDAVIETLDAALTAYADKDEE